MEFIKGKWYCSNGYYIKYSHTIQESGFRKIYGERICNNNYEKSGYWANSDMERDALKRGFLTDLSFLPKNHPDLQKQIIQIW